MENCYWLIIAEVFINFKLRSKGKNMLEIKTKTIATLGPASNTPSIISDLIEYGMDVARINMSHFKNKDEFEHIITIIRNESNKQDKHIGILVDLAGPKIRLDLKQIGKTIDIKKGDIYNLGFENSNDIKINPYKHVAISWACHMATVFSEERVLL